MSNWKLLLQNKLFWGKYYELKCLKKSYYFQNYYFLESYVFISFLAFDVYGSVNNGSPKKRTVKPQKCYVSQQKK